MNEPVKVLRTVGVSLTSDEITKLIKDYLGKEGFEVHGVDFKVSKRMEDSCVGEHEVLSFNGCTVSCRLITERRE
jgi:hypothetical protein